MESTGNHGGIQQLLAAEHEAQQIVNAARSGNYKIYSDTYIYIYLQSETLESRKILHLIGFTHQIVMIYSVRIHLY